MLGDRYYNSDSGGTYIEGENGELRPFDSSSNDESRTNMEFAVLMFLAIPLGIVGLFLYGYLSLLYTRFVEPNSDLLTAFLVLAVFIAIIGCYLIKCKQQNFYFETKKKRILTALLGFSNSIIFCGALFIAFAFGESAEKKHNNYNLRKHLRGAHAHTCHINSFDWAKNARFISDYFFHDQFRTYN